jgi:hypothetical protein
LVDKSLQTNLRYYGISPWEIEVLYGILNDKFMVVQEETEQTDPNFVSVIIITIPVQFSEEFFKWFEFKRWEKIKSIIKEMKRRRGRGNAIKIEINFTGELNIRFVIDLNEKHFFDSAIEKIDNVVELLQYHLGGNDIPRNISDLIYKFDTDPGRWKLNMITADDKKFISTEKGWKIFT